MHAHPARATGISIAPHIGQQQVPRQHAPAMLEEVAEQEELLGRESHLRSSRGDDVPIEIYLHLPEGERRWWRRGCRCAPKHRAHACDDLTRAERLGDVIVGAELE